ncbi:MAG: hypothetical protein NVS2B8_01670 [Vulcanimicrobiaceae bacterium]
MHALIRPLAVATLAAVAIVTIIFIVKLVFAAATLVFVAIASFFLYHFGRALVRRIAARSAVSGGPRAMLRR